MQITSVSIRLVAGRGEKDPLLAFAKMVFDDCFMVEDLRIIQKNDRVFVSMPSRKNMDQCHECGSKNHLRARYCNDCGSRLRESRRSKDEQVKLFLDTAHPLNTDTRDYIEETVLDEYYRVREEADEAASRAIETRLSPVA